MHDISLRQLHNLLKKRQISCEELTQYFINKANELKRFNTLITLDESHSLKIARKLDHERSCDEHNFLWGIALTHKDIFSTLNLPTTCASKMLEGYQAPFNATIVERLNAVNAITIGKSNMDEFGMGSSNESSYFGSVSNPWDESRVPGGSSGGAAASVLLDITPVATASDTGGSIRQPAALCGVCGIKPTYGLVSRFGMVSFGSSLEQPGPIAKNVEDLSIMLHAMAGFDERDAMTHDMPIPNYLDMLNRPIKGIKIGLPKCYFDASIDDEVKQANIEALKILEKKGACLIDIDLNLHDYWVSTYYLLSSAEATSNLARFDGVRYGHCTAKYNDLQTLMTHSRDEGFGAEVKRRILTGNFVSSSENFKAYYSQALKVRRMIQNEVLETFKKVDVIAGPTTPSVAFKKAHTFASVQERYIQDKLTVLANLAGIPAISIPVGFHQNLPIGMQFFSNHFQESTILNLAHQLQLNSNWHLQTPNFGDEYE